VSGYLISGQDTLTSIYHGDCLDILPQLPYVVDAVVTDPPYGLEFMGKDWDHGVPGVVFWEAIMGVMKPGAHLLAFGGTRTHHRLTVAIEDAGFEIRDCLMWVYGSGFPKSLDVSKAIDKAAGADRKKVPVGSPVKRMIPGADQDHTGSWIKDNGRIFQPGVEISTTDAAKQWEGWGTALKPAWEPIILARKPLGKGMTVAANVLEYGTGGLNVNGCRIETYENLGGGAYADKGNRQDLPGGQRSDAAAGMMAPKKTTGKEYNQPQGRWPANLIHDGSDEVVELFPYTGKAGNIKDSVITEKSYFGKGTNDSYNTAMKIPGDMGGSAARFFYCAKASKKDRSESNNHPTVKPLQLMRYLCRLITPPSGLILDPFSGSGSTLIAARNEGFDSIGIDTEEDYCSIARDRLMQTGDEIVRL